ncbi:MAG: phosphate signaling complex protein PhoU [Spirochaetia bacterium]
MEGRTHFAEAMKDLYQDIVRMGTLVEEALRKALISLSIRDTELAQQVIDGDKKIDELQQEIEERCTQLIALEQPVATDLREILTSTKIVTDLERIGDHARHLAKSVEAISDEKLLQTLPDIQKMTQLGINMVHDCITAFVEHDAEKAIEVAARDDEIDSIHKHLFDEVLGIMKDNPDKIAQGASLMFLNRFLERLGDHVTNMCEWVVFAKKGEHVELNP